MGIAPYKWSQKRGALLALREEPSSSLIYEDETQYCYVSVRRDSTDPEIRSFYQDRLDHSIINMQNPSDLLYFYTKIYADVTSRLSQEKEKLTGTISAILILIHLHEYENFVTSIKHKPRFSNIIKTQIHHNAGKQSCLEMFILEGEAKIIKELLNVFQTSKNIDYLKLLPLT